MMNKFNFLVSSSTSKQFNELIYPILKETGINICREITAYLYSYKENFYKDINDARNDILSFDHVLWYYDDDIFLDYCLKISQIPFKAISPFGTIADRPSKCNFELFYKKLATRTKIVYDTKNPSTLIMSPLIGSCEKTTQDQITNYVVNNRKYFDIYAMSCCHEQNETNNAKVVTMLNDFQKILYKPAWIKTSVASCDHPIIFSSLSNQQYTPMSPSMAGFRFKQMYNMFMNLKTEITWLYSGVDKDIYAPELNPRELITNFDRTVTSDPSLDWNYQHFMGIMSYDNKVKESLLKVLTEIAKS